MMLRGYSQCSILKGVLKVGQKTEVKPGFVSKDSEGKLNLLQSCFTVALAGASVGWNVVQYTKSNGFNSQAGHILRW